MKHFDLITVGNAIIDIFLSFENENNAVHVDEKNNLLSFPFGQKIKVDHADLLTGGNANNVAVGISRLGFTSAIAAEVGDDEFAHKIVNTLQHEKVDTGLITKNPHKQSSFAIGINVKGERTLFVEHIVRDHIFYLQSVSAQWVYLTSLGNEWRNAYHTVIEYVEKNNIKLAFNPGTYQLALLGGDIYHILSNTQILFVNKEEGVKISNSKFQIPNEDGDEYKERMKELLNELRKHTPGTIVLTDGRNGSFVMDKDGKIFSIGMFDVTVVERTGAGDAYASGFLGATIAGLSTKDAMVWGSINSAAVVTKVGAQAGLLTKEELEKRLHEHKEFQPKPLG